MSATVHSDGQTPMDQGRPIGALRAAVDCDVGDDGLTDADAEGEVLDENHQFY